jgi:benzoate membrane transport protein
MFSAFPFSALIAGFVTVLVGFTSSVAIVFQAASAVGATPAQTASWLLALGLGMGATSIGLSLRYRTPIVTAWSTPGAALLATSLVGVPMGEAIGAFVLCGVLITLAGLTGWFERLMDRIPMSIAAAMLAGVLLRFGLNLFMAMQAQLALVLPMFLTFLLAKRWLPRYAVPLTLLLGIALAALLGLLHFEAFTVSLAVPVFTMPVFSVATLIGVGIPLFVVTMASQNAPGVAVLRARGYATPVSPLISTTGIATVLLAPFGGFALNLAAITAAICMDEHAHHDPAQRYKAAIAAGGFYLLVGLFGATVAALFAAFPAALIAAIAGLALIGTIGSGLATAMQDEPRRDAALITFLVTASGFTLWGIGSAFWGLAAGALTMWTLRPRAN